ncbi:MAG: hypothetical protein QG671_2271, partial [Actinomycetota bacterium]|nr:hypothetical protein [Actinomycetota bacterium]
MGSAHGRAIRTGVALRLAIIPVLAVVV